MLTNERIKALEGMGFKRWTKGDYDRLYINASDLGLSCTYYKTGNIRSAEFQGFSISNSQARSFKYAKTFVDVKTGEVYSDIPELKEAAQQLLKNSAE